PGPPGVARGPGPLPAVFAGARGQGPAPGTRTVLPLRRAPRTRTALPLSGGDAMTDLPPEDVPLPADQSEGLRHAPPAARGRGGTAPAPPRPAHPPAAAAPP